MREIRCSCEFCARQREARRAFWPITPQEMRRLYWVEGLSSSLIAERLRVSRPLVLRFMREHEIPRRSPAHPTTRVLPPDCRSRNYE